MLSDTLPERSRSRAMRHTSGADRRVIIDSVSPPSVCHSTPLHHRRGVGLNFQALAIPLTICATSRIDFFGNIVDPIPRKPRDPYNVRLYKSRLDIVDDGAKLVLSRHRRCLHRGSDKKCRRWRPDVTDAIVQEILRPVEVAAGDKAD